tara:strand:- start:1476 stop:1652 length:177 start_codon:yes stop_codon:yes gene_type:complete
MIQKILALICSLFIGGTIFILISEVNFGLNLATLITAATFMAGISSTIIYNFIFEENV